MVHPHPATELAALTHALRAELARRAASGWRGAAGPQPKATARAAPPDELTGPAARQAEREASPPKQTERIRTSIAAPSAQKPAADTPATPAPPAKERALFGGSAAGAEPTREVAQACPDLPSLAAKVGECTACGLCQTRTQTVFADGQAPARVLFIGEAPGFHEDQAGVPFVGRAGQLLTDIIVKGMKLARESVYIANVLKCRPPENRDPTQEEKALCTPFLDRQIELVDPAVIIPLGRHAACHVLGVDAPMSQLRGRVHRVGGRVVVPTYHPAYLLRSPEMKKPCWEDIQLALAELARN